MQNKDANKAGMDTLVPIMDEAGMALGEACNKKKLRLTTQIADTNPRHTRIKVYQNGGLAGVLVIDTEHAGKVERLIQGGLALLGAAENALQYGNHEDDLALAKEVRYIQG